MAAVTWEDFMKWKYHYLSPRTQTNIAKFLGKGKLKGTVYDKRIDKLSVIYKFWECASYSCHSNCRTFLSTGSYSLTILLSITSPVIKHTYAMFTIDVNVYVVVLCPVDEA